MYLITKIMSSITREEYKTYVKIRAKLLTLNQSTQTEKEREMEKEKEREQEKDKERDTNKNDINISLSSAGIKTPLMIMLAPTEPVESTESTEQTESDELDESLESDDSNVSSHDTSEEDGDCPSDSKPNKISKKRKRANVHEYDNEQDYQYYKKLSKGKKADIDTLEKEIADVNLVTVPLRFKILESKMDLRLKSMAINKLDSLYNMDPSSGEYCKLNNYIENLCKIPVGKYQKMGIDSMNTAEEISNFLDTTKQRLDDTVYGHTDAKNQIILLLAKWIANPDSKGLVIGIEGPMGAGKTTLCKDGICEALGLPFGFVTLGGINDGSHLVGFNYTYEGSRWGRIADILMKAQCMNPVLFFDELDKISATKHGEEIVNILIHLTDSTQNDKFHDKYFSDVDFDLSKCLIVFSYNDEKLINPILKDRMVTIKTNGYALKDKLSIAKYYMLPDLCKGFGFQADDIVFDNDVLSYIVSQVDEEKGVRNLKRALEELVSQINLHKLLNKDIETGIKVTLPFAVTRNLVERFLIRKRKDDDWPARSMYL